MTGLRKSCRINQTESSIHHKGLALSCLTCFEALFPLGRQENHFTWSDKGPGPDLNPGCSKSVVCAAELWVTRKQHFSHRIWKEIWKKCRVIILHWSSGAVWGSQGVIDLCVFSDCVCVALEGTGGSEILIIMPFVSRCVPCPPVCWIIRLVLDVLRQHIGGNLKET